MNDTSSTPSATPIPNNYGVATSMADVQNQINEMEAFFETGATLPVDFRLRQLRRLQAYLLAHEQEALDALHADLGKSAFESYATELGLVYDEIRLYLRKLRQWARPRRVPTPLAHFPSSSTVYPYPFGVAAVLSPRELPAAADAHSASGRHRRGQLRGPEAVEDLAAHVAVSARYVPRSCSTRATCTAGTDQTT
ncbi:MAG: aldehyde dehydrogenase family protein [Adlercreutzia equolifaciens]